MMLAVVRDPSNGLGELTQTMRAGLARPASSHPARKAIVLSDNRYMQIRVWNNTTHTVGLEYTSSVM